MIYIIVAGVLFTLIAFVETWWTRRERRREIARAHEPKPFERRRLGT